MRCPLDDAAMREVTRQGVKVDICPQCKGVWLDRGELDHLIEVESEFDSDPVQPTRISRGPEDLPDARLARHGLGALTMTMTIAAATARPAVLQGRRSVRAGYRSCSSSVSNASLPHPTRRRAAVRPSGVRSRSE